MIRQGKKIIILSFFVLIIFLISFFVVKTFAYYKDVKRYDIIKSKIGNFEKKLCRKATTLHTEECKQTSGTSYCSMFNFENNIIEYGNIPTENKLVAGDAYDCDVNGDGIYNAETERFYYVSDLDTDPNYAVLVYYNNVINGEPNNIDKTAYSTQNSNSIGPDAAVKHLPTISKWPNVQLRYNKRTITNELYTSTSNNGSVNLPTDFDYSQYVARPISAKEVNNACNASFGNQVEGELDSCNYLMENTRYSDPNLIEGFWLESVSSANAVGGWRTAGVTRNIMRYGASTNTRWGIRPVIEIPKSDIDVLNKSTEDSPTSPSNNPTYCANNNNILTNKICKRAVVLHQEYCPYTSGTITCYADGYKGKNVIYGKCGTQGKLTSGDAFDCDVNGDGIYNPTSERFYYVSDYYNTKTNKFEEDKATLIYYSNTYQGLPNNTVTGSSLYNNESSASYGPNQAINNLPTKSQWSNVKLFNENRAILSNNNTVAISSFSYANRSARLLTSQEIAASCNLNLSIRTHNERLDGELSNCNHLLESGRYANSNLEISYWIENTSIAGSNYRMSIATNHRFVNIVFVYEKLNTRPVIELYKSDIEY